MNPVVTRIPSTPRPARAAAATRERRDDTGFEQALGAAAAAQPPVRTEKPAPVREREAKPADDGATDHAPLASTGDDRAPGDGDATGVATPANDRARESGGAADAATPDAMAPAAASAAGAGAQNAPAPPPAADRGETSPPAVAPVVTTAEPAVRVDARAAASPTLPAAVPGAPVPVGPLAAAPIAVDGGTNVRVVDVRSSGRPARAAAPAAPARGDVPRPAPAPAPAAPVSAPAAAAPARPLDAPEFGDAPARAATPAPAPDAPPAGDAPVVTAAPADAQAEAARLLDGAARGLARAPLAPATAERTAPIAIADAATADPAPAPATSAPQAPVVAAVPADARASRRTEADAAPASASTPASTDAPVPSATADRTDGRGTEHGSAGDGSRRERDSAAAASAGDGDGAAPVPVTPESARGNRPATVTNARETATTAAARAVEDPRLEPMRRAADQVTLRFDGEDGLEGRLRITVRGDSVRASILSSHDGTIERLGGELGSLRRALNEQGFQTARVAIHDTRTSDVSSASDARQNARDGEERRQGEPQRRPGQGRESRQGSGSEQGRRGSRDERRSE